MKFHLRRLDDHDKDTLLAELRRVADLVPGEVLTLATFDQHANISASAVRKRFGGWQQALIRAGLADRYAGPPIRESNRTQPGKYLSAAEIVSTIQTLAAQLGRSVRVNDCETAAAGI